MLLGFRRTLYDFITHIASLFRQLLDSLSGFVCHLALKPADNNRNNPNQILHKFLPFQVVFLLWAGHPTIADRNFILFAFCLCHLVSLFDRIIPISVGRCMMRRKLSVCVPVSERLCSHSNHFGKFMDCIKFRYNYPLRVIAL